MKVLLIGAGLSGLTTAMVKALGDHVDIVTVNGTTFTPEMVIEKRIEVPPIAIANDVKPHDKSNRFKKQQDKFRAMNHRKKR